MAETIRLLSGAVSSTTKSFTGNPIVASNEREKIGGGMMIFLVVFLLQGVGPLTGQSVEAVRP
jgi:hypothetical protein